MSGPDNELSHEPVAVLGAGSWGTALAIQFARAGHPTRLWTRSAGDAAAMRAERRNSRYLPEGRFPEAIEVHEDLAGAVKQAGLFVMRGLTPDDLRRAIGTICPNVLFPYARVAVSQLVTQGGFPNFVLPPVDFDQLFARGLAQQAAQAQAQGAAN